MSDQPCTCNRCPQCGGILPPVYWPVYPMPYYPPVHPALSPSVPVWPQPPFYVTCGPAPMTGTTGSTVAVSLTPDWGAVKQTPAGSTP